MSARAIVLTSTSLRHHFIVNELAARLEVVGVWQEEKKFVPLDRADTDDDRTVIAAHFAARDRSEADYFAAHAELRLNNAAVRRRVAPGGCNDTAEVETMRALRPDVVVVFGTEILRAPILSAFGMLVNLHLGLSPYYRGAGTNFWPLVNREPEYVGGTIHYIDAGLDSGPVIAHVRPPIQHGDGPHDLGNRTIVAAASVLAAVATAHARAPLAAQTQPQGGRLYLRKHFTGDAVRQLYRNFEDGMVDDYLAHRAERDARLVLLAPPPG